MRVLITGVTGFVGSHLADYLVARDDVEIFGTHRWQSRMDNIEHLRARITSSSAISATPVASAG